MKNGALLAIVLTVFISGVGMAATFSGKWATTTAIALQTFSVSSFSSTLTVDYTTGTWTFRSLTQVDLTGWNSQIFSANGTIGAATIASHLAFDPQNAAFSYWNTVTTITLAGVTFTGSSNLTPVGMGWTFGAKASLNNISLSTTVYFNEDAEGTVQTGSYALCFYRAGFDVQFPFGCVDKVDLTFGFSAAEGFEGLTINLNDIVWDQFPAITFDIAIKFVLQTEGKTLTITPTLNLKPTCITLYGEVVTGTSTFDITGIRIYGVSMQYSWDNTSFATYSSFDPDKNYDITGEDAYWEKFVIKTSTDSCCGGSLKFDIATYFQSGSAALFDWGKTDINLSMGFGSNITMTTGTSFTAATGFEEWRIGFELDW